MVIETGLSSVGRAFDCSGSLVIKWSPVRFRQPGRYSIHLAMAAK